MSHRLNARLDDDLADKLASLRRMTKQTTTEVVRAALELYYETLKSRPRAYEVLAESGFIGCASGPRDLSLQYKDELARSLGKKA